MSEDKILPAAFQKRNSRGALTLALSIFAGLAAVIVFWAKEFDTLLSFTIFLDCFGVVLSAGSIFIIRKRTAHLNNTGIYQMKLYPLLPLIFIAAYFKGFFSALNFENGIIANASRVKIQMVYVMYSTLISDQPESVFLNNNDINKKPKDDQKRVRVEVDITFFLFSSVLKNRKKAVSIP